MNSSKNQLNVAPKKPILHKLWLFLISCAVYIYQLKLHGESILDYYTVKYYRNLIEDVTNIALSPNSLSENISCTMLNIAAFEPGLALFYFTVSFVSDDIEFIYHTLNFLFLLAMCNCIIQNKLNNYVKFLLFCGLNIGFYEYVAINITHRLKLALLFILLANFTYERKNNLSLFFLTISLFIHYTLIFVHPIVIILTHFKLTKYSMDKYVKYICFVIVTYILIYFSLESDHLKFSWIFKLKDKFQFHRYSTGIITAVSCFISLLIGKKFFHQKIVFKSNSVKAFVYIHLYMLTTLLAFGRSRLIMLYYLAIIIYFAHIPITINKKEIKFINGYVAVLILVSIFIGFARTPLVTGTPFW